MKSNNNSFKKRLKISLTVMSSFALIVLFQNCGRDGFQTKMLDQLDLASENQNDQSELPNDDLSEITDDNEMQGITDIFNNPQNENNSEVSVDNSASSIIAASSTGKVYYVSTSGNNSNPGTINKPFKTIAYAVRKMVAGDTTYVRSGVYTQREQIRFSVSGTASRPIRLLNAPGEMPIIDFGVTDINRREPISPYLMIELKNKNGYSKEIGWITIEGFEIRRGYNGMRVYNGRNIVIRRNWIHDNLVQGIIGGGLNIQIDRNRISKNGGFSNCAKGLKSKLGTNVCVLDHGIYMHGSNIRITNNVIDSNLSYGVQINGSSSRYDPAKHAGPEFAGARNWLVANNTIAYQYWASAITVWGSLTQGTKIINNIFYENSTNGPSYSENAISLSSSTPATGIEIRNNLSYSSKGRKFIRDSNNSYREKVHYTQSNNIINTVNPGFVNAGTRNFKLKADSPAINKGLTLSTIKFDFLGVARPRGGAYDIGAYEY